MSLILRDSPEAKRETLDETITSCGTLKRNKAAMTRSKKIPAIGQTALGIFFINYTKSYLISKA
jgi:hypothetical protein